MNKIVKVIIVLFVIFITGCSKEKYITCNIDLINTEQNYSLKSIYIIYYKDNYVTKIEKEDIYESKNKEVLEYFSEYKKLEYTNFNDLYGGYNFNIDVIDNKVTVKTNIDFTIVDINKMVLNGDLYKDYVISNKLTTSGAKEYYEAKGAECNI